MKRMRGRKSDGVCAEGWMGGWADEMAGRGQRGAARTGQAARACAELCWLRRADGPQGGQEQRPTGD